MQNADILQLCNVMLLVDWLQESDFLLFEHTKEWHSFHVYMTTSVSAYDKFKITLNDYSRMTIAADISIVTFFHNVGGENS